MKKSIIISVLMCVVTFVLGIAAGWHGCVSENRKTTELLIRKSQLADTIMSRNDVYDMDGGDQMAEYLFVSEILDTLLAK